MSISLQLITGSPYKIRGFEKNRKVNKGGSFIWHLREILMPLSIISNCFREIRPIIEIRNSM